jgi:hypothetical protein
LSGLSVGIQGLFSNIQLMRRMCLRKIMKNRATLLLKTHLACATYLGVPATTAAKMVLR